MIAMCQIRDQPHYRRQAFMDGLRKTGYSVVNSGRASSPADLLIIWNRYGAQEAMADSWERTGGTVLVTENGYIGKDDLSRQYYAISAHGHNGAGWWPTGDGKRFAELQIELSDWKLSEAGHYLVCGQRGIGSREMASPDNWHNIAASKIKKQTSQEVRIRLHPGNKPPATTLYHDLNGAEACVVWSSSSGVKALVAGYPVYFDSPYWICSSSALRISDIGKRVLTDDQLRLAALERMAWAQYSVLEIESGLPFDLFKELALSGAK